MKKILNIWNLKLLTLNFLSLKQIITLISAPNLNLKLISNLTLTPALSLTLSWTLSYP